MVFTIHIMIEGPIGQYIILFLHTIFRVIWSRTDKWLALWISLALNSLLEWVLVSTLYHVFALPWRLNIYWWIFNLLSFSCGIIIEQSDVAGEVLKLLYSDGGTKTLGYFTSNLHLHSTSLFFPLSWNSSLFSR